MPDIHDLELDARPTREELCEHKAALRLYQPHEFDTNIVESYTCIGCGKRLDIPEPDWDLMREGK